MEFTIERLPYEQLHYDARHPRLLANPPADPEDLALAILRDVSIRHFAHGYDPEAQSQLEPLIVVPQSPEMELDDPPAYTVLDGNIRLAHAQLSTDRRLRRRCRIPQLPALTDRTPTFTCAVFPTRKAATPHVLRRASPNDRSDYFRAHWEHAVVTALNEGCSIAEIAQGAHYAESVILSIAEAHHALNQITGPNVGRGAQTPSIPIFRQALSHDSIRAYIGLPQKPDPSLPKSPLSHDAAYIHRQAELMDMILQETKGPEHPHELRCSEDIAAFAAILDDAALHQAYQERRRFYDGITDFLADYSGEPTFEQISAQLHNVQRDAYGFLHAYRRDHPEDPVVSDYVSVARVYHTVNDRQKRAYVIHLSSPYPHRYAELAAAMEQRLSELHPHTIVEIS